MRYDELKINIVVAGIGCVGLSLATLLARHNKVATVDVLPVKVEKINNHFFPIQTDYIEKHLAEKDLDLTLLIGYVYQPYLDSSLLAGTIGFKLSTDFHKGIYTTIA